MISSELIALVKCLKELKVGTLEDIKHRISFQKKIYLLQACGVKLGYVFRWDQYGPYSRDLARNAGIYLESEEEIDSIIDDYQLEDFVKEGLEKTKKLISPPSSKLECITEVDFVELLSSLHFMAIKIKHYKELPTGAQEIEEINKRLLISKPHLKMYNELLSEVWEHLLLFFPFSKQYSQKDIAVTV